MPAAVADALEAVLERAKALGFLGPGPVAEQRRHAEAFLTAIDPAGVSIAADLGSGGGLPGLVLAAALPAVRWTLIDGMVRRTRVLADAVHDLELSGRLTVVTARAEDLGRDPAHRAAYDLVVARSFGPPAVLAECGAPLLRDGGQLVVSEPPDSAGERWPAGPLALLGLEVEAVVFGPPAFIRLRRTGPVPDSVPRRVGLPAKRPRW